MDRVAGKRWLRAVQKIAAEVQAKNKAARRGNVSRFEEAKHSLFRARSSPARLARNISGHRMRPSFDRYGAVPTDVFAKAGRKLAAAVNFGTLNE